MQQLANSRLVLFALCFGVDAEHVDGRRGCRGSPTRHAKFLHTTVSRLTAACSCCTTAAPAPHANRNAMVTRTQVVPRSGIARRVQRDCAPRPLQLSAADPDFLLRCPPGSRAGSGGRGNCHPINWVPVSTIDGHLTWCKWQRSWAVLACPSTMLADSDMNRSSATSRNASTTSLSRSDDPYHPESGGGRQTPWGATRTIVVAGLGIFFLLALLVRSYPACAAHRCRCGTRSPGDPCLGGSKLHTYRLKRKACLGRNTFRRI